MTFDPSKVDWNAAPVTGTITQDGIVLENRRVGRVFFACPTWTLRNCPVVGELLPAAGDASVVTCKDVLCKAGLIEDCDISVATPDVRWQRGVFGHHFTTRGTVVHGTVDGFGWYHPLGGTMLIRQYDTEVRDLTHFDVDPAHADGSHNDAIQAHSPLKDALIQGGRYDCGPDGTATLMANVTSVDFLRINRTQLLGGRSSVNLSISPATRVTIKNSVLGGPVFSSAALTLTGNTHPDGTPANTISQP